MTWHASLELDYTSQAGRTVAHHRHNGPLRILQSLYPEGDAVCHNILVHPPGGLVGGDTLEMTVKVASGAHGLVTTPGATRFYKTTGDTARQTAHLTLEDGARLEWLPMEALAYSGCIAQNHLRMDLAPGAEMMAWDVTALGLPNAGKPFERGSFLQHMEMPGVWLERGLIDAADTRLLSSPLGLANQACIATLFFACGSAMARPRRDVALDAARAVMESHSLRNTAGVTAPNDRVIVLRVLAPLVEPAMELLKQVWAVWRGEMWAMTSVRPRVWAV